MTVEVSRIYLLEGSTGDAIEAELRDAIDAAQLADWKLKWQPAMFEIIQELARRGVPPTEWPQSWHWNWERKSTRVKEVFLALRGFSVCCAGMTQGMMRVDLTKAARHSAHSGKPLIYIDFVEVAPWNWPILGQIPRYKGVGIALIAAAIELSEREDFKGRIGLHALPQSEGFYRDRCEMIDLGPDDEYDSLRYFEMTSEQSHKFVEASR